MCQCALINRKEYVTRPGLDQFKTKIKLLLSSDDASEASKAPQASGAVDTATLDSPIHIKVIDVFQKPHSGTKSNFIRLKCIINTTHLKSLF